MALPATHLRFALDVANRYPIKEIAHYLSGTLYPDSRWLTGVDRTVTHAPQCRKSTFPKSDFTLGWHIHCVCDKIQTRIYESSIPHLSAMSGESRWIRLSVTKMIQDMADAEMFDVDDCLARLDHVETPSGENAGKVRAYFQAVTIAYGNKRRIEMDDYHQLWLAVGLAPQKAGHIMDEMAVILNDADYVQNVLSVYPAMVREFVHSVGNGGHEGAWDKP